MFIHVSFVRVFGLAVCPCLPETLVVQASPNKRVCGVAAFSSLCVLLAPFCGQQDLQGPADLRAQQLNSECLQEFQTGIREAALLLGSSGCSKEQAELLKRARLDQTILEQLQGAQGSRHGIPSLFIFTITLQGLILYVSGLCSTGRRAVAQWHML